MCVMRSWIKILFRYGNSRGITVYVRDDLSATQLDEGLPFHEHLLLKLNTDKQDGFILGVMLAITDQ